MSDTTERIYKPVEDAAREAYRQWCIVSPKADGSPVTEELAEAMERLGMILNMNVR